MTDLIPSRNPPTQYLIPWLVLLVLLFYSYAKFVKTPYVGFEFSQGKITILFLPTTSDSLQIGDQLLWVGDVEISEFNNDFSLQIFDDVHKGILVPIILDRDGKTIEVDWGIPGPDRLQILQRLNSIWWLSYVFWAAGTATILFIRPKDLRWKLLIAFNYLTAVWLGAGSGPSHWHILGSGYLLTSTIWLCLPVFLHMHWEYPKPFKKLPKLVWFSLYTLGGVFAVLEWLQLLPHNLFYTGFLIAVLGSLGMLVGHWIMQKDRRKDIEILGWAFSLSMLPLLGIALVSVLGFNPPGFISGGAFLALPALPGAYFLVAYRRQFQYLGDRVTWLTRLYLGLIFAGTAIVIYLAGKDYQGTISEVTLSTGVGVTLVAIISAITGFSPFFALPALAGESIAYSQDRGEIEIRANRIFSLFLFVILLGGLVILGVVFTDIVFQFSGNSIIFMLITTFFVCLMYHLKNLGRSKIMRQPQAEGKLEIAVE